MQVIGCKIYPYSFPRYPYFPCQSKLPVFHPSQPKWNSLIFFSFWICLTYLPQDIEQIQSINQSKSPLLVSLINYGFILLKPKYTHIYKRAQKSIIFAIFFLRQNKPIFSGNNFLSLLCAELNFQNLPARQKTLWFKIYHIFATEILGFAYVITAKWCFQYCCLGQTVVIGWYPPIPNNVTSLSP